MDNRRGCDWLLICHCSKGGTAGHALVTPVVEEEGERGMGLEGEEER